MRQPQAEAPRAATHSKTLFPLSESENSLRQPQSEAPRAAAMIGPCHRLAAAARASASTRDSHLPAGPAAGQPPAAVDHLVNQQRVKSQ